jgi:hypothetical protein
MWTLVLVFLLSSQEPQYVTVEAADVIECVDEATRFYCELDEETRSTMKWVCAGPEGEIITDKDRGECN